MIYIIIFAIVLSIILFIYFSPKIKIIFNNFAYKNILFLPNNNILGPPSYFKDIMIDNTINAWLYMKNKNLPIILHCHGNAGNIQNNVHMRKISDSLNANLLIFDYRGYGKSNYIDITPETLKQDADNVYNWLLYEKKYSPSDIILYGESMGGYPASYLASKYKSKCLILQSTFSSLYDLVEYSGWVLSSVLKTIINFFIDDIYINYNLQNVESPIIMMHSKNDGLIPYQCMKINSKNSNFAKLNNNLYEIEIKGTHNYPIIHQETLNKIFNILNNKKINPTNNKTSNYDNLIKPNFA